MTSSSQVKQARKMNHAMIKAKKLGMYVTAALAQQYRDMNMMLATKLWIAGK